MPNTPDRHPLPTLPTGIQDFQRIRQENCLYVDKTKWIYQLITSIAPTFLSRPRRFGKTVLISTMEAIFKNQRDLFKGLWIDQSDYQWEEYPVIRLDMSKTISRTPEKLEKTLIKILEPIADHYQCKIAETDASFYLMKLINRLSEKNQVAVLVDEYDKPLLDRIDDIELMKKNREILKEFYGVLKSQDEQGQLRFIFLTGVTKFSKVSIFSGLNQLNDITLDEAYADLLGYTKEELEHYFQPWIETLALKNKLSVDAIKAKIKHWYNGYQFSEKPIQVYNPFSTLSLLTKQRFSNFWFASGTPTFLMKLLEKRAFNLNLLQGCKVEEDTFSAFELENINLLALLYQSGYLTIKAYDERFRAYTLDHPNFEVEQSFLKTILIYLSKEKEVAANDSVQLTEALTLKQWDVFFNTLDKILLNIPYDIHIKQEKYYQTIFYLLFRFLGVNTEAEARTNVGRMDVMIEMPDWCAIFEFKLDKSAEEALAQIHEKKYYEAYQKTKKGEIFLFGVNFSSKTRTLEKWVKEVIPKR